ncbi:MAG: hypothetical protein ACK439_08490 [Novosphingobium sp.]
MNRSALSALVKSVAWGGVAGALPFLLVTVPLGLSWLLEGKSAIGPAAAIWAMVLPLAVAWPLTLLGFVLLGLPCTWLLARSGHERGRFYILAGLIAGSLPFLAAGLFPEGLGYMAFSVPGGLAGAVAGWHWGRHRDRVTATNQQA